MNDELIAEVMASVREGVNILRGEAEPSRSFTVDSAPVDVKDDQADGDEEGQR